MEFRDFLWNLENYTPREIEWHMKRFSDSAFREKYGEHPDAFLRHKFCQEWLAMECSNVLVDAAVLCQRTAKLKERHQPYWLSGSVSSSFILYLLGATNINPLPAHYYCPVCKTIEWDLLVEDGFDLPSGVHCPKDHILMIADGHTIPWQSIWGRGFYNAEEIDLSGCLHYDETEVFSSPDSARNRFSAADLKPLLPGTVADMIAAAGMMQSEGVWDETAKHMLNYMGYQFSELIVFREDVYCYLLDHGFLEKDAWKGMEQVGAGKGLPVITEAMAASKDKWVLKRFESIKKLVYKADVIEKLFYDLLKGSEYCIHEE